MAKKKKKIKLKLKNIFICLILVVIICYILNYILMLPINNIYVNGNKILSENEILTLAELESYPSFLLTSSKEIKEKIKKNEYIKAVKVTKSLKNKISIEIKEYQPLCILNNDKLLLENGQEVDNIYQIMDLPYLITTLDEDILSLFIKKVSKIDKNILRQISQIEYLPVNVDKERFLLYMDDGNEVYITLTKINKLNKYNEIVEKMDGLHGIIYLDSGDYIEIKNAVEVINANNSELSQDSLSPEESGTDSN